MERVISQDLEDALIAMSYESVALAKLQRKLLEKRIYRINDREYGNANPCDFETRLREYLGGLKRCNIPQERVTQIEATIRDFERATK